MSNQRTPLYEHQSMAGARFTDFGGWDMPVQFAGILAEHAAVRSTCGLFDLGHMGRLQLRGPGALPFLDYQICRPLASMVPGQVRYGLILEEGGGVVDDVLVSRESEDAWHVVVNAGNREAVLARWRQAAPADCELVDRTFDQGMIAVQGPDAQRVLGQLGLDGSALKNYRFLDVDHPQWGTIRLSRTGYTGEDGFECFAGQQAIIELWQALQRSGVTLCGLGARDLLRLEAAMPLYGHELDRQHSPLAAGLAFAVSKKGGFCGAEALQQERDQGLSQVLVGLEIPGKRPAREGYPVLAAGRQVGQVTSGSWSPQRQASIAMAYVEPAYSTEGSALSVSLRGKSELPATVVELPFYRRA